MGRGSAAALEHRDEHAVGSGRLGQEQGAGPPPGRPWEPWGSGALLLPQAAGTDGMFVAVLERRR